MVKRKKVKNIPSPFNRPKYWTHWILVFFLKLFVMLPYKAQMNIGKYLGLLGYLFAKRRKHITIRNLIVCFPDKPLATIESDCRKSFESIGQSAIETIIAWFMPEKRFRKICFEDRIHPDFKRYNKEKKSVLLLGTHFMSMEIVGRYMATHYESVNFVYQKHKSPFFEHIMTSSRERYAKRCLQRKNVYAIVKALKRGETVWYAPDQDFGKERSIFVPFFKIPCSTLIVTPWLAEVGQAKVIPCYYIRKNNLTGYQVCFLEQWDSFPTGDNYNDALRYNVFLEDIINRYPEQYLWQHRRFKTRPLCAKPIY